MLGGPLASSVGVYNTCAGYAYVKAEGGQVSTNWGLPGSDAGGAPYEDLEGFLDRPAELTRSLMGEGYTGMNVWPFDAAAERSRGQDISSADLREAMRIAEAIRAEAGGAMDILIEMHSLGWSGGITEAVRIASLGDTYGVSFAPHDCTGPISFAATVQVVASQPNGVVAETVRASQASWHPQIMDGLPAVRNGRVKLAEAPGLGVTLREEFTARPDTSARTTSLT